MPIPSGETTDDTRAGDGGVDDGDETLEFGFEDGVEGGGGGEGGEAVAVRGRAQRASSGRGEGE